MRTGINLLLWTPFVDEGHLPLMEQIKELGYDGVELPLGAGDLKHYETLGPQIKNLELVANACMAPEEKDNPASPDPAVRAKALLRLQDTVRMTTALGGHVLCGPLHSAFKVFSGKGPTSDEMRWSADVLASAAEFAVDYGVQLNIEPLNRFECYLVNTVAGAAKIVDLAGHPNLGLHYDTHHMHIEEDNASAAIARGADILGHVHISESTRGIPGTGQVAWEDTFRALHDVGYDGWFTIEAFSRADPDFAAAIHIWRDFCDDPMTLARQGLAFMRDSWERAQR
jgi:D-psicose/D-tagatose/L-ribulose 3-epimerase